MSEVTGSWNVIGDGNIVVNGDIWHEERIRASKEVDALSVRVRHLAWLYWGLFVLAIAVVALRGPWLPQGAMLFLVLVFMLASLLAFRFAAHLEARINALVRYWGLEGFRADA